MHPKLKISIFLQGLSDKSGYIGRIREGEKALHFMKATYSPRRRASRIELAPEILERVYMYCTAGRLSAGQVRQLAVAGVLSGMGGVSDREIVHGAVEREGDMQITMASCSGSQTTSHITTFQTEETEERISLHI